MIRRAPRALPGSAITIIAVGLLAGAGGTTLAAAAPAAAKVEPELRASLAAGGAAPFFFWLERQANVGAASAIPDRAARGRAVFRELTEVARASQAGVLAALATRGVAAEPFYIANAVRVVADLAVAEEMAARPDVARVLAERVYPVPAPLPASVQPAVGSVEWNVAMIRADQVWAGYGVTGEGIVVGNIDTGVDLPHQALDRSYRGNVGGVLEHDYNWWSPDQGCDAPCDPHGHGTHTLGTIVGGDGPGPLANDIGVAPGARWIAAGCGFGLSTSCLLSSGQFMLAPTTRSGANPDPDRRPHVVSNSWGFPGGHDPFYVAVVDAWRAAGIFPVFAAGNEGPWCSTLRSPGDYPQSFTVGATDALDQIAWFSSRGSSSFAGAGTKPDVVAPGDSVRSSYPGDRYEVMSGTSMAVPHVTGLVALLWSSNPALRRDVAATEAALASTAKDLVDLTCGGDADGDPNETAGEGRIDALDACAAQCGERTRLSGFVRGASAGGAIAGATLRAVRRGDGDGPTTRSGGDGAYALTLPIARGGAAETYDVTVSAFAHAPGTFTVTALPDGVLRRNIRLQPLPRHVVAGVVLDAKDLTPVAGATVELRGTPLAPRQTDASGAFAFPGVPAGRYRVDATGTVCQRPRSRRVVVESGDVTTAVRLRPIEDAFGHQCREEPLAWIEGTQTVPFVYPGARVPLPFPFLYYGRRVAAVHPTTTGFLSFSPQLASYANGAIPSPFAPNDAVYPFWDDLLAGTFKIATVGEPGDRVLAIEYEGFLIYDGFVPVEFEVLLHERDGSIVFQYRATTAAADGRSATIGIESRNGSDALLLGFDQPIVRDGLAVRFTPPVIDSDGDGVAEQFDLCPAVPDPDQRDRDGDGLGNACDDLDGSLRPTRLQIRRSTSEPRANGRVLLAGEIIVQGAGDSTAVPDGLTLRLVDSLQLDQTARWTGDECKVTRRGTVRCRRRQPPRHVAEIVPLPSDIPGIQAHLLTVRLVQLDLDAPFLPPLRVTMTNDPATPGRGIDRLGTPLDCAARVYGLECLGGRDGSASRAFLVTPPRSLVE